MNDYKEIASQIETLCGDKDISGRSFFPHFHAEWNALLNRAAYAESYFDAEAETVFPVLCAWEGVTVTFHFEQSKMADWYFQEAKRHKRVVFLPERVRRNRAGELTFHDSPCRYDPAAQEPGIGEKDRNILAAAIPGRPPELWIVYGNKWVEKRFNPFLRGRLSLFLIQTDYVPAFLASPLEVCLYLFLMDCCIIKEDRGTVKDEDLRKLLHVFRPSPMLKIKGLL